MTLSPPRPTDEPSVLFDPARHEPLIDAAWDPTAAIDLIRHIVADTEARFDAQAYWPVHPLDADPGDDTPSLTPLYHGACGTSWALGHFAARGIGATRATEGAHLATLLARNRTWLSAEPDAPAASYLMGDTPILMLEYAHRPRPELADQLAVLIASNHAHPTRELMWGAPGTLLAARFLHARTGEARWAELFRQGADALWDVLQWCPEHACHYWVHELYGRRASYLGGAHGFVATAVPLIAGRRLLGDERWRRWEACIVNTVQRAARIEDGHANWPVRLHAQPGAATPWMMQFCHGAPGFVICLARMPGDALDPLLQAAGEAIWAAGPLTKGSNLCHGTGGNGYAFLALHRRTGDPMWLARARAFAMHGIAQTRAAERKYGQLRYALWTGDPGFAVYLWDCLHGTASFPTLDVFW
ncbi:LanC-like protein [Burkholderia sp. FERM BP-3421]|jgi:hypothetical protein|nr:LanC-like protein [Burkholderia sp. FERM BP-3421]